jgi:hypothetical protein
MHKYIGQEEKKNMGFLHWDVASQQHMRFPHLDTFVVIDYLPLIFDAFFSKFYINLFPTLQSRGYQI